MASINPARYFGVEAEMDIYAGREGPLAAFGWARNRLTVKEILL